MQTLKIVLQKAVKLLTNGQETQLVIRIYYPKLPTDTTGTDTAGNRADQLPPGSSNTRFGGPGPAGPGRYPRAAAFSGLRGTYGRKNPKRKRREIPSCEFPTILYRCPVPGSGSPIPSPGHGILYPLYSGFCIPYTRKKADLARGTAVNGTRSTHPLSPKNRTSR